jgi:glycosyltransferase involved in cell wall biosynthesis
MTGNGGQPLRIALVATSDFDRGRHDPHPLNEQAGGAGMAAISLLDALLSHGVEADLLVSSKLSQHQRVHALSDHSFFPDGVLDGCEIRLNYRFIQGWYSRFDADLRRHPLLHGADVIHFHNLHWRVRGLSPALVAHWSLRRPTCYTLHDTWALTGHCINPLSCQRWRIGCGRCPDLGLSLPLGWDLTRQGLAWKRSVLADRPILFITPSDWLRNMAVASPVTAGRTVQTLRNVVDLPDPPSRQAAKAALGLPMDMPAVLYAANHLGSHLKGADLIPGILADIAVRLPRFIFLSMGGASDALHIPSGIDVRHFGRIDSPEDKINIMAAADLMIYPTRADSMGYVVAESLWCGTPVIASRVGGVPELLTTPDAGLTLPLDEIASMGGLAAAWLAGPRRDPGTVAAAVAAHLPARVAAEHIAAYKTHRTTFLKRDDARSRT